MTQNSCFKLDAVSHKRCEVLTSDLARLIENENLIDRFEMCVIIELPDHLLVSRHFEKLRLLTDVTVTEIIAKYRVPIGKSLTARHQPQGITRQVGFIQLPDDFFLTIDFNYFVSIAARNQ